VSNGISGKLLGAVVLWLVLLGIGVAVYKFVFAPRKQAVVVEQSGSQQNYETEITVALDSFSGYCVFRSDAFRRELNAQGIGLNIVDDQANYGERIKTLRDGDTPFAVFTIDALLTASARMGETPGTIVMIVDESNGADAMVAYKQGVPNLNALDKPDARFVVTRDSPSETLARVVMASFRLPQMPESPWIDAQGGEDALAKLQAGSPNEPRAYVMWEPHVSRALETPGTHVLIDSSKFKSKIVDVLVVQRAFLLANEPLVRKVLEAYRRAAYELERQPGGMAKAVRDDAQLQGAPLSETQAKQLAAKILWKNTQENYAHFGVIDGNSTYGLQPLDEIIRGIVAVLEKTGAVESDPTSGQPHQWYYDKLLRAMHDEHFHPGLIAGGDEEQIRGHRTAEELSEAQWNGLTEIGTLEVEPLVFARGTSQLTPQSKLILDRLAETLKSFPSYYVIVRGNARREGDPAANKQLAEARAKEAASHLLNTGVEPTRIRALGSEPTPTGGEAQTVRFVLGQRPF
jgi:ABC-type nitrate/sulfonate/bicarbonate transport system substrate-binding protein